MATTKTPKAPKHVAPSSEKTSHLGPAPSKPPPNAAELLREAAATGAGLHSLRRLLSCSGAVFNRWLDEFPELRDALDEGRERERRTLHTTLFRTATEGTGRDALLAAMFLLKSRHGYVEGEQPQQGSRVNVTVNLPGAKPLETIEVIDADARVKRLPA